MPNCRECRKSRPIGGDHKTGTGLSTHPLPLQHPQDGAGRALEGAGDPTEAGASVPHPPHRFHLPGLEISGRSQRLPLLTGSLQPIPGPPLDGRQFLVGHPSREQGQHLAEEGLGATLIGLQVARPLGLCLRERADLDAPVPQLANGPDRVLPGPADAVDGHDSRVSPPAKRSFNWCQPRRSWVPVESETPTSRKRWVKDTPARWSAVPGSRDPSRGRLPGAGGWCGCSRRLMSCREYMFMEQLPQRGNVRCCVVFHTPRLWNKRDAPAE